MYISFVSRIWYVLTMPRGYRLWISKRAFECHSQKSFLCYRCRDMAFSVSGRGHITWGTCKGRLKEPGKKELGEPWAPARPGEP